MYTCTTYDGQRAEMLNKTYLLTSARRNVVSQVSVYGSLPTTSDIWVKLADLLIHYPHSVESH